MIALASSRILELGARLWKLSHSDRTTLWLAFVSIPPVLGEGPRRGMLCHRHATDSHVDRTFFIEVSLIASAHRAVHLEQAPPRFSSNTYLTKGVLCPEKSIRSIKNSTVR
jgi:hypothetical protein